MNVFEAEKAFREMLPCETAAPEVSTMKVKRLGSPTGILTERHESMLTKTFLIFPSGEKSVSRYQIEFLKLAE